MEDYSKGNRECQINDWEKHKKRCNYISNKKKGLDELMKKKISIFFWSVNLSVDA
jgi:hypothetical protein